MIGAVVVYMISQALKSDLSGFKLAEQISTHALAHGMEMYCWCTRAQMNMYADQLDNVVDPDAGDSTKQTMFC